MVEQKHGKKRITVSFKFETLKAENAADDHIRQLFLPKLAGIDGVGMLIFEIYFGLIYIYLDEVLCIHCIINNSICLVHLYI